MKKRSLLASLLAALLVLVVFTGCAASSKMAAADTASVPNGYYDSKQEAAAAETPMEAPAEPEEEFAYDTVATTEAGSGAAETPEPDHFRCRLHRQDHLHRVRLHRDDRV